MLFVILFYFLSACQGVINKNYLFHELEHDIQFSVGADYKKVFVSKHYVVSPYSQSYYLYVVGDTEFKQSSYFNDEFQDIFSDVAVVASFNKNGRDYVVLKCSRPDKSFENVLVYIPPNPFNLTFVKLESNSNKPFHIIIEGDNAVLMQETDKKNTVKAWLIKKNKVFEPTIINDKNLHVLLERKTSLSKNKK